jgi:hypothetical protein
MKYTKPEGEPVSTELVAEHLTGFIDTFVDAKRRERWREFAFKNPEKAVRDLHKLPLDLRYTTWLDGDKLDGDRVKELTNNRKGILVTFTDEPRLLSSDDAAYVFHCRTYDAIYSVEPGRLALYFNHDGAAAVLRR